MTAATDCGLIESEGQHPLVYQRGNEMNLKHIKEALRMAGLRSSEVDVAHSKGHIHIRHNGKLVIAASSPKDPHTAALRIAKELKSV